MSDPRDPPLLLHGYWRSTASYRVRIALNHKRVAYAQATHDLRIGEHRSDAYCALNPQALVPVLQVPDAVLTQSSAIIEWLEDRYPDPPLLPRGADDRAIVRGMAAIIGCDIHPLNNLRVLRAIQSDFGADANQTAGWIARWIGEGFAALEAMIARYGGTHAFGDAPTIADVYLVPQVYSAERFAVDLSAWPCLTRAASAARSLPAFAAADPAVQPDADPA